MDVEVTIDDHDQADVRRELKALLKDITSISINGYTEKKVTIVGESKRLKALAEELKTWKPSGGWSNDAQKLFEALEV